MHDRGQSPRAFKNSGEDGLEVPGRALGYCIGERTLRGGKGGGGGRESVKMKFSATSLVESDGWVLFWPNSLQGSHNCGFRCKRNSAFKT